MAKAATPAKKRGRRILGMDDAARQAERRRLLLDAALELFGTKGYARTSIESLCQTAGIGTNSFYELFPTKEAVLIALYDRINDGLEEAARDAYLASSEYPQVVRALVAAFVHAVADDPRVAQVAFLEAAGVSPEMEVHRRRARDRFYGGLEAIGAELRATAAAPASSTGPTPRRNAIALVGAIIEMTVDWINSTDPDPIDDLIDDIASHCERVMDAVLGLTSPSRRRRREPSS